MHLYMLTRGHKEEVERWVRFMSSQFFPYKYNGKDMQVEFGMRPIQLWECAFPADALGEVLTLLQGEKIEGIIPAMGLTAMRAALKCKKIPEDTKLMPTDKVVPKKNVAVYPFGIREDTFDPVKNERL